MNRILRLQRAWSVALVLVLCISAAAAPPFNAPAPEPVDWQTVGLIRNEGFRNSKVMDTVRQLTDVMGPRLTGSPNLKRANEWTRDEMTSWGLENARLESFEFGRGWHQVGCSARMVAPDVTVLHAISKAWSPGTNGKVRGQVAKAKITTAADLEKFRGKLAGKIVLLGDPREAKLGEKPTLSRYTEKELSELGQFEIPRPRANVAMEAYVRASEFRKTLNQFLVDEKVLAVVDSGRLGDAGLLNVQGGGSWKHGEPVGVPSLVIGSEDFGRISRLLDNKIPVELELDVQTTFFDEDTKAYNTVAEIPGSDKKDEVVMLGGHIDSWHGSTGATDNAAGTAVAMEALRILKALNIKPRRTIRVGLWAGEEQGLLGSRAYVSEHFGSRAEPADPEERAKPAFLRDPAKSPLTLKPAQSKVSAYFNLDNGTGKIRGIYAEENAGVMPIFEAWLQPFKDLGANVVTMRKTGGTDHIAFDAVGIPGFQFIQDDVEYETRTHHTTADSYERLQREDLMQAAVIMASFVYHAAMRDEMLPRKPLPASTITPPAVPLPASAKEKKGMVNRKQPENAPAPKKQ